MFKFLAAFYMLPGQLILWWTYQNPSGGISGVAKSGRNYRSPTFTFLTATGFWATALVLAADSGIEFGSSNASGPLVKPGTSSYSASAPSAQRSTTDQQSATDSACEKAKKAAARAESVDELELARAKVEALC